MSRYLQHRKISGSIFCALIISALVSAVYARYLYLGGCALSLQISMRSSVGDTAQLYLDTGGGLSEREVVQTPVQGGDQFQVYHFPLPRKSLYSLRLDPLQKAGAVEIKSVAVVNGFGKLWIPIDLHSLHPANEIKEFGIQDDILGVVIQDRANDPQLTILLPSPLKLDSLDFFPLFRFIGYWLGGFLISFAAALIAIRLLVKLGVSGGFFDHPGKTGLNWIRRNRLYFSSILCLLAFRIFFLLTYPLNTCSDASVYYLMMHKGMSTLIHATGYPYLMHFFAAFLPTKTDLLVFQHLIDFGTQLVLMNVLRKRFGLIAAVTAGLLYGFELRAIHWVSFSSPEWLQGAFFALAFVAAIEAYFASGPLKKFFLYVLSAWFFAWTVLVKLLTVILLPAYLILFMLEGKKWKGRWLCSAVMGAVVLIQVTLFWTTYHFPSTGTIRLTHDVGWILSLKLNSFLPEGNHFSKTGPWSKRYCILISEMPGSAADLPIHDTFWHVDSVPQSVRQPYQERYRKLLTKSDAELQQIIDSLEHVRDIEVNILLSYYYLGLPETDLLMERAFLEAVLRYPGEYLANVVRGIKESFFIEPSYHVAILHKPHSSNRDFPFQLNMSDIVQDLPWGYALFNASPNVRCMYDEPVFLKAGLHFFTFWGEYVYIPTIFKWLTIVLALVIASVGYRKNKDRESAVLYLSLGSLIVLILVFLSNMIFEFRDKELQACQHLLCVTIGISVSSLVTFVRSRWHAGEKVKD